VARSGFFQEVTIYAGRDFVYHSSYECPAYPEPREAWGSYWFFQKPI
jgi:hypothetical protein